MRMLVLPAPLFAGSEPAAAGESKDLSVLSVSFLYVCVPLYFITSLLHTRPQEPP
jgi:hypothetical protein